MYRVCGGGGGGKGEGEGGLEMITINKGLARVIPDFIRQQEMESRWQGLPSLFGKLIWILCRAEAPPPLTDSFSKSMAFLFHLSPSKTKSSLALSIFSEK